MRIISQGGNADLPYEEIALCMACEDIIARHNDKEYLMARYSTMDKAKKAMEMLREKYAHMKRVEYLSDLLASYELSTLSNKEAKLLGDEVQNLMCFQFPQDEDVEV